LEAQVTFVRKDRRYGVGTQKARRVAEYGRRKEPEVLLHFSIQRNLRKIYGEKGKGAHGRTVGGGALIYRNPLRWFEALKM